MAAMRKISVHRIGKTKLTILRPLLGVWRSEIDSYIEQQGLEVLRGQNQRELEFFTKQNSPSHLYRILIRHSGVM